MHCALSAVWCKHLLRGRGATEQEGGINMARKPGTRSGGEFVLFDVIYEDGRSARTAGSEYRQPRRASPAS